MSFHRADGLRYYRFDSLAQGGVTQAVFTRWGGVSPEPWLGLNLGGTVGDDPQRVSENRQRALCAVGRATESVYDVWQVHGDAVVCTQAPRPAQTPHLKSDAILTDRPEVTLIMRFADCVPIFLFDPRKRVVGLVHAGWQGTVLKVAEKAVRAMQAQYGCAAQDILAGIGPSIGQHHYPVGQNVIERVEQTFGAQAEAFLERRNGNGSQAYFDLWEANRHVLAESGVEQVEVSGICTACHLEDWYSHRGEQGKTGRFGAIIALNND
jgi:YfiH family protein